MDEEPLNILLVEDSPADARLIRETLVDAGVQHLEIEHVQLVGEGITRLKQGGIDCVLLDLFLPDNMGPDTVQKVIAVAPHTPVVVLTGVADKQAAMESVRHGAQDYLVKGQLTAQTLVRAIHYAVERKRFERALAGQVTRDAPAPAGPAKPAPEPVEPAREADRPSTGPAAALDHLLDQVAAGHEPDDDDIVTELEEAGIPADRARGLVRVLDDFLALARHEPRPGPCDASVAFDQALARFQTRILDEALHVRRYPLPRVWADPALLTHLFEAALTAGLALQGSRGADVQLSCERAGESMRFTLTTEGPLAHPAHADAEGRGHVVPASARDAPELVLVRRLAARLDGAVELAPGPHAASSRIVFAVPALDVTGAPDPGAARPRNAEEK